MILPNDHHLTIMLKDGSDVEELAHDFTTHTWGISFMNKDGVMQMVPWTSIDSIVLIESETK